MDDPNKKCLSLAFVWDARPTFSVWNPLACIHNTNGLFSQGRHSINELCCSAMSTFALVTVAYIKINESIKVNAVFALCTYHWGKITYFYPVHFWSSSLARRTAGSEVNGGWNRWGLNVWLLCLACGPPLMFNQQSQGELVFLKSIFPAEKVFEQGANLWNPIYNEIPFKKSEKGD